MITRKIIPISQYDVKCPYSITPIGISIHNTGNSASADNENKNLSWTRDERSFHYVTDEYGTIQNVEENRNTWANGDYSTGWASKNYINWEISELNYSKSEEMAIKDIAQVLKKHNWTTSNIKRHLDFTPSSGCPRQTNKHWNDFLNKINIELNKLKGVSSSSNTLYKVQVGAFKNKENAIKLQKELISKGYQAIIK